MRTHFGKTLREHKGFLLFIGLMVMFRSAVADWNDVPSGSMEPTILTGDRIFVNKLAYDIRLPLTHVSLYRLAEPQRGEIVIFDSKAADRRLVKRVEGVPGDIVQMIEDRLWINGQPAEYTQLQYEDGAVLARESLQGSSHVVRLDAARSGLARSFGPVTVPEDHYLVLGDNRHNSADSRFYGFVPRTEIVGRSGTVVLSLDPDNFYLPRADRFVDPL
jgi:signal peptidase I